MAPAPPRTCVLRPTGTTSSGQLTTARRAQKGRAVAAAPDADLVLACGPNRMLAAVAARWPEAQVAVETYMGCGTGVCLGCAVPLARGGYDRACKEGPVYRAADVDWASLPSHLPYAVSA